MLQFVTWVMLVIKILATIAVTMVYGAVILALAGGTAAIIYLVNRK